LKPIRLIGVIDLLHGQAVHARGGRRAEYLPVETAAGVDIAGDPIRLARLYIDRWSLEDIYVADLDAIGSATPQEAILASIAQLGASVWVDAGISSIEQARHAAASGASQVIVGLETLHSFEQLHAICSAVGGDRVAFSLDVRDGVPVIAPGAVISEERPNELAASAVQAGVGAVIVLDLARVGTGAGLDAMLIGKVRQAAPGVMLLAGGGVRGPDDLTRLADMGCDGALVATALHSGALDPRQQR
jgi:phosphoribosylformimino-5-aminoimidazole carboxamide ribotide isomerase